MIKKLHTPLIEEELASLESGDRVYLTGTIFAARDAAHKRLLKCIQEGKPLPLDLKNQVIYYAGPCPAPFGMAVGSCGPTTSGRMDTYTPFLLDLGLKATIGKGYRSEAVKESMLKNRAIYFIATGGAGALIASKVKNARIVAYEELGPEAIWQFEVEDFPLTVGIDLNGRDVYETKD